MKKSLLATSIILTLFMVPGSTKASTNPVKATGSIASIGSVNSGGSLNVNAYLTHLVVSAGTLSPAFAPWITSYTESVNYATNYIKVTPTTNVTSALITVNGKAVKSGSASGSILLAVGVNTITIRVGGTTGKKYMITVTREVASDNALLSSIRTYPEITLIGTSGPGYLNFKANVPNSTSTIQVIPTARDANATITVNGVGVLSGVASANIHLVAGPNTITTVITAQDGITTRTVIITIDRALSNDALLSSIKIDPFVTLLGTTGPGYLNFKAYVANSTSTIQVIATAQDASASIIINGVSVISGAASPSIHLAPGPNTITVIITAQDGVTTKTIILTVNRALSSNAEIASISLLPVSALEGTTGAGYLNFKSTVSYNEKTVQVVPTAKEPTATITVNGFAVISGSASSPISLAVGKNTITTTITAQDGITTKTVIITLTREAATALNNVYEPVSVEQPVNNAAVENDGVLVHHVLSPNGDGINDFLVIDGINAYPDNKLTIINTIGVLVFEAKGYDNTSKVFDGHASKTGAMQVPGTYFYALDYSVNGVTRHKTGYIVLKY